MLAAARRSALVIAVLALAACDDGPLAPTLRLAVAEARWEDANVDSYEMTVNYLCGECLYVGPARVTVSRGEIVSRLIVATGDALPASLADLYPDVPGLFAIVREALADAHELHVEYDETYGFPTVVSIDWDENAVDDEVVFRVENFAVRLD